MPERDVDRVAEEAHERCCERASVGILLEEVRSEHRLLGEFGHAEEVLALEGLEQWRQAGRVVAAEQAPQRRATELIGGRTRLAVGNLPPLLDDPGEVTNVVV
jgi:hypothetical protein